MNNESRDCNNKHSKNISSDDESRPHSRSPRNLWQKQLVNQSPERGCGTRVRLLIAELDARGNVGLVRATIYTN